MTAEVPKPSDGVATHTQKEGLLRGQVPIKLDTLSH